MRSNWLRAPQDLNACDWVPSFTIGSTGSRPSTHGTRAASLSDRALSSWQALKKQPRHDAQGEFKQVLKLLVVLDSCEAAAVWLKWHAAGACSPLPLKPRFTPRSERITPRSEYCSQKRIHPPPSGHCGAPAHCCAALPSA